MIPPTLFVIPFQLKLLGSSHKFMVIQMIYLDIWIKKKTQRKVFCNLKNEILEETYSRSAFLEYLEKFFNFFCLAPTGGAFMGSVYLLVSPQKILEFITAYHIYIPYIKLIFSTYCALSY